MSKLKSTSSLASRPDYEEIEKLAISARDRWTSKNASVPPFGDRALTKMLIVISRNYFADPIALNEILLRSCYALLEVAAAYEADRRIPVTPKTRAIYWFKLIGKIQPSLEAFRNLARCATKESGMNVSTEHDWWPIEEFRAVAMPRTPYIRTPSYQQPQNELARLTASLEWALEIALHCKESAERQSNDRKQKPEYQLLLALRRIYELAVGHVADKPYNDVKLGRSKGQFLDFCTPALLEVDQLGREGTARRIRRLFADDAIQQEDRRRQKKSKRDPRHRSDIIRDKGEKSQRAQKEFEPHPGIELPKAKAAPLSDIFGLSLSRYLQKKPGRA
jgi:hypothetical protein